MTKYSNLDPFVPVQENDTIADKFDEMPYVIYTSFPMPGESIFKKREILSLYVIATTYDELSKIVQLFISLLDREDYSAHDVNEFNEDSSINFSNISVVESDEPKPAEQPQGRIVQTIRVKTDYIPKMKNNAEFEN